MLFARFRGNPNTGDIDTKDNSIITVLFFAGFIVTLLVIVAMLMFQFL